MTSNQLKTKVEVGSNTLILTGRTMIIALISKEHDLIVVSLLKLDEILDYKFGFECKLQ